MAIHALEQRQGVDVLTAPEVTTESGRQAQMQAEDVQTIVTGTSAGTGATGGTPTATAATGGNVVTTGTATITPSLPIGPQPGDVIPYVS